MSDLQASFEWVGPHLDPLLQVNIYDVVAGVTLPSCGHRSVAHAKVPVSVFEELGQDNCEKNRLDRCKQDILGGFVCPECQKESKAS